jgi:hypothetical protein
MNRRILIIFSLFVCTTIFSATDNKPNSTVLNTTTTTLTFEHSYATENFNKPFNEWVLLKEVSGIKVYYKISKCESQNDVSDPLKMVEAHLNSHETFGLKFVNENATSTSISFSKITTTDGTDEMQTISISSGITIIDSCESTAKLILTRKADDKYPTSITAYLQEFKLTINN